MVKSTLKNRSIKIVTIINPRRTKLCGDINGIDHELGGARAWISHCIHRWMVYIWSTWRNSISGDSLVCNGDSEIQVGNPRKVCNDGVNPHLF